MRFWLWLTTGMVTKEWVAIHRKHHRYCELNDDPHSPVVHGIWNILFKGALYYNTAAKDKLTVEYYGKGTPDDYIENKLYTPHSKLGVSILLVINMLLFGFWGLLIWGIQMIWIPFWAAGVINGLGHWWGYRNGETRDQSKNISPIGFIIGGEELHNNHHLDPANPRLSKKFYEVDIGWIYLHILRFFKLAKLRT